MKNYKLKEERDKQGLTQSDLADKVDTTKQTIYLIENMKTEPKLGLAAKIAQFFRLPIEDIFKDNINNC
jgi:putative transcriptional regulator